jgi:hypothetical protein
MAGAEVATDNRIAQLSLRTVRVMMSSLLVELTDDESGRCSCRSPICSLVSAETVPLPTVGSLRRPTPDISGRANGVAKRRC